MAPDSAEVAIIGAGVTGISTAAALWARGVHDVVVLDASGIASKNTALAAGIIRKWHADPIWSALASESWGTFSQWQQQWEGDLFRDVSLSILRAADGPGPEFVGPYRVRPGERVVEATALRAKPRRLTLGLARSLTRRGVRIRLGVRVSGFVERAGRVMGLRTTAGAIACRYAVAAVGGALSDLPPLAALPVRLVSVPVVSFAGPGSPAGPILIDLASSRGLYLAPDGATWLATLPPQAPGGADTRRAGSDMAYLAEEVQHRLGLPRPPRAVTVRHGKYDVTPDAHPLVGRLPGTDGCLVAVGLSGSGFQIAPAVARHLAELITEGVSTSPVGQAVDPARFTE